MLRNILFTAGALSLIAGAALAGPVTVEVTNATHGIYFTPLLVTAHDAGTHLFSVGTAASPDLQAMAEGGDISGLVAAVGGEDADTEANPAGGLLAPGATATATIDTSASGHTTSPSSGCSSPPMMDLSDWTPWKSRHRQGSTCTP